MSCTDCKYKGMYLKRRIFPEQGKGNKVKNWKQKAISVWFKDENKLPGDQNDWIDEKLLKIRNE